MIILSAVVIALLLAGGAAVALITKDKFAKAEKEKAPVNDESEWGNRLTYKGKKYRRNTNLQPVLFIGVDESNEESWNGYEEGYEGVIGNSGRADTIILFILDTENNTDTVLSVSRDTITDVDVYDMKGNFAYTTKIQLAMQYSYGDSPSRSLFLTKRTVDRLLYDIRIDGSLSLTVDGISAIVNQLGGIELTMPRDYTYIDPRYEEGATLTLYGDEMEHFIRYRNTGVSGSNEERVERQSWLVGAVFKFLKKKGSNNYLKDLIDSNPEYIQSNCSMDLLKKLTSYSINEDKYKVPGTVVEGEFHDEFYVDEEALQDMLVELLYVPAEDD